jgi:hypothetical protein
VPPPLPSTLFSGKDFRNANNKALKLGSVTPNRMRNETLNGAPNDTPIKELGKGLVEFPVSIKKKRSGPAECGIGQDMGVDAMEVDADAVGQHDEGGDQQPDNEVRASTEVEATVGITTAPEATTEENVPEPIANIVAMNVEPALGLSINENEHHLTNNHINSPLPANIPALGLYDPSNFANDNAITQAFGLNGIDNTITQIFGLNSIDPASIHLFTAPQAHAESPLPAPMTNQPPQYLYLPQAQPQKCAYNPAQQSNPYPTDPSNPMPNLTAELHPPEPHPRYQVQVQQHTNLDPQDPSNYYYNNHNMYPQAGTIMPIAKPGESAYAAQDMFFGAQLESNTDLSRLNPNLDPSLNPEPALDPSRDYHHQIQQRTSVDRGSAWAVAGGSAPASPWVAGFGPEVGGGGGEVMVNGAGLGG